MRPPQNDVDPALLREHLVDRFEIFDAVGKGASSTVYRARTRAPFAELPAGREVALKVLRPELAADQCARASLHREAELGRSITARHVVAIHGSDEVDGGAAGRIVYLVTDLVRGRTLRDLLRESGPVVGDLARRIGEQAALALAALHEAGIVHRDVKPENLLITDDRAEIRLADLGLARPDDETGAYGSSGGFHGSLAYAAPEVLRGRPATAQSDLYALGVVLYEVLTGHHPFAAAKDGDEMLHAHLNVAAPRVSHLQPQVSAFLEAVVAELLEKDVSRRPADAAVIARTLHDGEASAFWRVRERMAPVLASRRRLLSLRRSRHTAFVDRDDERAVLDALLRTALDGSGRSVLVSGHAGSGRRRLLDECVDRWLDEHPGLCFLGGNAEDDPTSRLGTPFPQILLDVLLDGDDETSPRARERLVARAAQLPGFDAQDADHLAALCAGDGSQIGLSAAARADLFARAILEVAHRQRATVLRIDRTEDLSTTGRLVVDRLIDGIADVPVLLVLVGPSTSTARDPCVELAIGGLPRAAFAEFGHQLFRAGEASDPRIDAAWAPLAGQPRALLEAFEELALDGRLRGRPGDYHDLSTAVRELIPARPALQRVRDQIIALPLAQRHVLQAAAVLGDRFELADLASLTGRPELEILESLGAADNRIVGVERGRGRFRHRAYRLATIAATPPEVRRRMHRDAAWVLEDRDAPPLEIGMHLSRASEDQACIVPLLSGLEGLIRSNVRKAAVRVAERLHLHLNRLPRTRENLEHRLEWLLSSGDTWALVDQEDKSARAFRKALLIAQHLGRRHAHARAMVGLADLAQHKGRLLSAIQMLTQVADLLATDDSPDARLVRARALLVHGRVMAYQGRSLEALQLTNEALRALPPGHPTLEVHLRVDQARWLALRLRFVRALANLDRAEVLAESTGDPYAELRVRLHRGRCLGALGDREGAEVDLGSAHDLAIRLGDERMRGRAQLYRAELDAYVGSAAAARPRLLDAQRAARKAGDRVTERVASALLLLGTPLEPDEVDLPLPGIPAADLAWLLVQGTRRARAGDAEGARARFREAAAIERHARVHLLMRLAVLRAAGRDDVAERIVRAIAGRLPAGSQRRRFVAFAERVRV